MPQVSVFECFPIAVGENIAPGHRFQHRQVGGSRFVPTGDQPVDRTHCVFGADHEFGPRSDRVNNPEMINGGL
jgi:hypothetical protein